tara:strand:- start:3699 stop:4403 length:705 start_codon:yes stop_codon:yes gene_type:complete
VEEFFIKNNSLLTNIIEILAAVTGILLFKKYKYTAAKHFVFFLCYLSIGDLINLHNRFIRNNGILSFLEGTVFEKNYWWTTLYWKIGAILFFVFYYNKILKTEVFKNIIKYSGFVFFTISVIYILINWDLFFLRFFPIISIMGAVIIFMCTAFYFFEVLQTDKILTFYKSINFYISAAIFIWWLIITPIVFYDIYGEYRDIVYIHLRRHIYLFANILMYLTFTFALIWCKPEND